MMQNILLKILDCIFPLSCSFCGKYDLFSSKISICKNCVRSGNQKDEPTSENSYCHTCKSILLSNECEFCNSRNIFFSNLYYLRTKGELEREIIQKVKFGNSPFLSNFFRLGLKKHLPHFKNQNYSGIVSIPSNKNTIRKRPIPVCKPVITLLQKHLQLSSIIPLQKNSNDLQSGKSFRERFLHAQSAFEVKRQYINSFYGNYLLVDDVFTTGATINEIAKLLLLNGASKVDILVLVKGKQ